MRTNKTYPNIAVSYAITVCNELDEFKHLIETLFTYKKPNDEIVVLVDNSKENTALKTYLKAQKNPLFRWEEAPFTNNFSEWKNKLTKMCNGKWIFNIDADEYPDSFLIKHIHTILNCFFWADIIRLPRINTVKNITQEDIHNYNWKVTSKGGINWPDFQGRLYRNNTKIKWKNKVHETLIGHRFCVSLPAFKSLALHHPKDIKRQRKQNQFYETLETP